jgi:hypothetical protein
MHGEAVFEAMRAARVLGDVAADRTDLLARRIRCVVVAERCDAACDFEVGDARFDRDSLVRDIDIEHSVQPRETDHHTIWHGQRAAREPGAVTARNERNALACTELDDRLHFRRRTR